MPRNYKPYWDYETIYDLYVTKGLSTYEIAERSGPNCYANKVVRCLKFYKIPLRDKADCQKHAVANQRHHAPTRGLTRSPQEKERIGRGVATTYHAGGEAARSRRQEIGRQNYANMTEEQKAIFREKNCKAISDAAKNGSALEKFLFRELTGRGYNVSMHGKHTLMNENLQIDLFIDPQGVAIEVDGALHTCDIFNEPDKFRRRQERDELKNQLLLSEGYHLIRIQYTRDLTLAQKNELVNDLKRLVDRLADDDEAKLTIIKVN